MRTAPGGAWTATLCTGRTFTRESEQSGRAYGFAHGDINRPGGVQDGWFC